MSRRGGWLVGVGLLAALGVSANAQTAPPPNAQTASNMAVALAGAEPPKAGVALAVNAAKIPLPKEAVLPGATPTVSEVAALFGRQAQDFNGVVAVAPPSLTVVYAPPETPNPYDGMPPKQVMKLLTATFTRAQWKAFMGLSGVGYSQMQGDAQTQLFQALFPDDRLVVEKDNPTGPNDPGTKRDISGAALTQARLRLGYIVSLALQVVDKPDTHTFAGSYEPPDAPARYIMMNAQGGDVDREFGAQVRETIPNALKSGELSFGAAPWQVPVSLEGVKTVDDLVFQIGTAAHQEVYADPRYGARPITLVGQAKSARAADLLRALALCVGGTYRQVGPAFVLTDDVIGLGTKHALWKAFEDKAQAMLPGGNDPFASTTPALATPYTVQDISFGQDPLAFTPAQQKAYWDKWKSEGGMSGSAMMDLTVPLDQLSPAQQEAARQTQQQDQKQHIDTTLDGTVMIQAEPDLEITLPSLDGPVMVFQSYDGLLPFPKLSPAEQKAQQQRMEEEFPFPPPETATAPKPDLRALVQGFTRRAVRIAPKTAKDVTRDLAALQILGFNEVWFQITPGATDKADGQAQSLLAQAITEGRAAGIAVLPDLRLLAWGADAPSALLDRDITAQTASEADKASRDGSRGTLDTVTPFAPEVAQRLAALVRRLGEMPGVGGMVWEHMTPEGYEAFSPDGGDSSSSGESLLGYALPGRLAFLRQAHADPVDLYTNYYTDERAHVRVPGYDDDFNQERALYDKWRSLRVQTSQGLARWLVAALPPSFSNRVPRLPLIVPPANSAFTNVYGSWDNLRLPPPGETFDSPRGPDGQPLMGVPVTERMPSTLSYHVVTIFGPPHPSTAQLTAEAANALRQAKKRGDHNILIDAVKTPNLLAKLAGNSN